MQSRSALHPCDEVIDVEGQRYGGSFVRRGCGQPDSQLVAQALAEIQADPCGAVNGPPILAGKSLLEYPRQVALWDADPVVRNGQEHLVARPLREDAQCGMLRGAVLDGVADDLIEDKAHPFVVCIDNWLQVIYCDRHITLP